MTIQPPTLTPAPSPFSPTLPKYQTAWDSTSLGMLKTCPRVYEYQMLQHWEPRSRGVHLEFGGWYAAALERYAHSRARGASHDAASVLMVRWALEASGERTEEGEFHPWSPTLPDGTPHPDANIKNRFTLIRSLVWNVEERLTSPFTTLILANGRPAVELSFNFDAFEIGGETITLAGHLDEVVEADSRRWIRDDKTTKNQLNAEYWKRYTPDNQMSLYSVAGKIIFDFPISGVLVKGAQLQVNATRFATQQITRPAEVLTEWLKDTELHIQNARRYAEADYWPTNDRSCFLCAFKRICSVSPSHREAHLREDFVKRSVPWNPLSARGDV